MTATRQQRGRHAEDLVAAALERRGGLILARNARAPDVRGEIDLIALDGGELAVIEVKARRQGARHGPERPALAVGAVKQRKLRALAVAWLLANPGAVPPNRGIRFDVVGIELDGAERPVAWEWIERAF